LAHRNGGVLQGKIGMDVEVYEIGHVPIIAARGFPGKGGLG
jgi:hypothetical protein